MNKPDWKDAPEWANYLAMDQTGNWYWYQKNPSISIGEWAGGGCFEYAGNSLPNWEDSLEARP